MFCAQCCLFRSNQQNALNVKQRCTCECLHLIRPSLVFLRCYPSFCLLCRSDRYLLFFWSIEAGARRFAQPGKRFRGRKNCQISLVVSVHIPSVLYFVSCTRQASLAKLSCSLNLSLLSLYMQRGADMVIEAQVCDKTETAYLFTPHFSTQPRA